MSPASVWTYTTGGVGRFREVQDDERTGGPGVCTCTVGHDLDGGLALLGSFGQVAELPAHYFGTSHSTMNDRFVDHGP
jgi:hypothetical protein